MKLKNLVLQAATITALGLSAQAYAADPIIDYSDRDRVCETKQVATHWYGNTNASCTAMEWFYKDPYDHSKGQVFVTRYLSDYVPAQIGSTGTLSEWMYINEVNRWETMSCQVQLPYSHTTYRDVETCTMVPREPFVQSGMYEYGHCRYYTREGFVYWSPVSGADTYELQKYVSGAWRPVYTGTNVGVQFNDVYGGKTMDLRVRAKDGDQVGSYQYFKANIPSCWNGQGDEVK